MIRTDLDRLVVAARKSGKLAGKRLHFNKPVEQLFFLHPDGALEAVPIVKQRTMNCVDGSAYDVYAPVKQPTSALQAIIHTHQDRAGPRYGHTPLPGPGDGKTPVARGIPNYGITSVGAWVVRPGQTLAVELLDGVWGMQFNPEAFAAAMQRGAGNAAVGMGVKCR